MLDWDKLRVFYIVTQTKNITKAAERLRVTQSAVSRQITALEKSLGTSLFHRRPRGLLLTEQGELLQKTVNEFFQKLSVTENALLEITERPRGLLRVTASYSFGTTWLTSQMKEFAELYPDIELELVLSDEELSLSNGEANVAIRLRQSKHPDLVQKPLMSMNSSLYASNDYLRLHGIPKTLGDLMHHRIIALGGANPTQDEQYNWLLEAAQRQGITLPVCFRVNNLTAILRAVKGGMGVAVLPDYIVERARHVSRILDELQGPPIDAYLVYPVDMKESKRIRAFRHFIQRKIAEHVF